ncbi:alcohol dehydrogenase transcription factor myb/SANT-like domain-containing protein [Phthorimaea operculella]|nr:alcohol dehydrogenase transcription factor myb/SANT-like domain-containing protein [Phthorimaea operculella]
MITEFEKEKVFWTRKMNVKLVKFIESRPNIWNPKHPKYTSVEARDQTYNEFASKYGNEFTGQAVKERWTNIRSTFANYLRKVTASRTKIDGEHGEEYNVNWHLWEPCQFLMKVNKKVKASTSKEQFTEENREGGANENEETGMQETEENWSTEEETYIPQENNETVNESPCYNVANDLVQIFKNFQNDAFGLDNSKNAKIGRLVASKLSQLSSYDAAETSMKIMDILLLYNENNPMNPNNNLKTRGSTEENFIKLLKHKWDELHNQTEAFRYKIDNLQERLVDGKYLIQLNPDRGVKRRSPEKIESVCQPFDKDKFNFTKVSPKEILFDLFQDGNESEIHSLLLNVSPITRYHSLICPSVSKCLPQVVTQASLELALDIMFFSQDRDLRIGFNSLCALASVNHLHYHIFLEPHVLPVETAKCKQLKAHNLFITRGESLVPGDYENEVVRVIIWPRKSSSGAKQLDAFNVAVCELSGWFPVYDKTAYETLKTEDLENELKKWKFDNFDDLCEEVKTLF